MRPDASETSALLASAGFAVAVEESGLGVVARVAPAEAVGVLATFKGAGYESLVDFDGIDTGEAIELTWRLRSYSADIEVYVKAAVAYDAEFASVWNVYPSALMPERETAELLGLRLAGHPNPKRLLTTDGMPPLLRKSVRIRAVEELRRP